MAGSNDKQRQGCGVEEGPQALFERQYPARPHCRKLDGAGEAQLVKLACSQVPDERSGWTLNLLAGRLVGWRRAEVSERKTAVDWAQQVKAVVDASRYAEAERITLVCDNLNTHRLASLYEAFEPGEALRLAHKLELVHTPRHGSWLNMAEPELSVLTRQCLDQRIGEQERVAELAANRAETRNHR
jgi:hypothetical protein